MTASEELVTFEAARARIETVATERPDYVNAVPASDEDGVICGAFKDCVYFNDDGSPSCIVGTAFAAELKEAGVTPGSGTNEGGIHTLIVNGALTLTPRAARFLEEVQGAQDTGKTWAEAYAYGIENDNDTLPDDVAAIGFDY